MGIHFNGFGFRDKLKGFSFSLTGPKKIPTYFYIAHFLTIISAIGFSVCAYFTGKAEFSSLEKFELKLTTQIKDIYYTTTGVMLLAVIIGIQALYKGNKPCAWILYCTILGVMSFIVIGVGVSAINKSKVAEVVVEKALKEKTLMKYPPRVINDTSKLTMESQKIKDDWDHVQRTFKCCGLTNYSDWQSYQFGRTSLRVPESCCLKELEDPYCGINLLPEHENATSLIHTEGCVKKVTEDIIIQLRIAGIYGVILSVLLLILVVAASYFMMTKKI